MGSRLWKRTLHEEIALRCAMVEGRFLEDAASYVEKLLGEERAARQVPISGAVNPVRRMLGVTARHFERCSVDTLTAEFAATLVDDSASTWIGRLSEIGMRPIPTALAEGSGKARGLQDALQYLQVIGYSVVIGDWSRRGSRPFIHVATPEEVLPEDIEYAPDDPMSPIRLSWRRSRVVDIDGKPEKRAVRDVWDLSDMDSPAFRVMVGDEDITAHVPALREAYTKGRLYGKGYWWRYTRGPRKGRPFMSAVVLGSPERVWEQVQLTEGALDAVAYRTAARTCMIDAGHATREVEGFTTGTDALHGQVGPDRQEGSTQGPGDVRVWRRLDERTPGQWYQFTAAHDPESLLRTAQAMEREVVSQLGFPVELTNTGGEPIAHEVEAQQRAIRRWNNQLRAGVGRILRVLAAISNRQVGSAYPEEGYGALFLEEVDAALSESDARKNQQRNQQVDEGEE